MFLIKMFILVHIRIYFTYLSQKVRILKPYSDKLCNVAAGALGNVKKVRVGFFDDNMST